MSGLSFALESRFPKLLAAGYEVESKKDPNYNCVAWSAKRDQKRWWEPGNEPGFYWPEGIATDYSMESFTAVFQELGYVICDDGRLEYGFEKVALYEIEGWGFAHVSHQLPDGRWASKLGPDEDIEHNSLEALESDDYGSPSVFLKRQNGWSHSILRAAHTFGRVLWSFLRWRPKRIHKGTP
jgi:hypothetical protein